MDGVWKLCFDGRAGSVIPSEWFGQNLEITRSTLFGGLSAQLINNRKFSARETESFARGWEPVGDCSMISDGAGRLPALRLGDRPAGVVQVSRHLRMRVGIEYRWRLCVSGMFYARVAVRLGKTEATVRIRSSGGRKIVEGSLFAREPEPGGEFAIQAVGEGEMLLHNASLLPADAVLCGLRPDVLAQLRMLRPHSLRFPGGCYAEFCDWKQGLLEPDERGVICVDGMDFLLGPTLDQDPQDMNLDDFVAVCRLTGAEPQYTVSMALTTPESAAELVEYANAGPETRWGSVRAARGWREPHHIRRWYIGNEIYPFVPGMKDPVAAAERTIALARAMKRVDPSIELVPSNWALSEWNAEFLKEIERQGGAELFARASYHQYLLDIMGDGDGAGMMARDWEPDSVEMKEACLRAPVERILPRMRAARRELQAAGTRVGQLPLTLDEWNYQWGREGHPLLALCMMGLFNLLIRHGEEVKLREALYFHPINEGILRVTWDGVVLEDGAHAWKLAQAHVGRRALMLENPNPDSPCDVAASIGDGAVYVTLVNRSLRRECRVNLPGLTDASMVRMECWRLDCPENACKGGSMRPHSLTSDVEGTLVIPPASMAGIWYERGMDV